jgi:iron complex transport system ATP-binding protein
VSYALESVSVRVGNAVLLADASLDLHPGEILAVAGPNGAGKTTLVRVLAGDVRPADGRVLLDDRPLETIPVGQRSARRAVMTGGSGVAFSFTAQEVALLGRLPIHGGRPREADRVLVDDLLAAVDGAAFAGRAYATLSTGERQRVQLARAVAQVSLVPADAPAGQGADADTSRYLLLDEPTSSLDPAHQHLAMGLLRRQAEAGVGVLAVLHDLNLAAAWADRVAFMKGGRIVSVGTPAEVLQRGLLEDVYGTPMLVLRHPEVTHPIVVSRAASHA